jgi:hypothetical protein
MSKFIVGNDKMTRALVAAGVVNEPLEEVRRIVIDLRAGSPGMIYIEKFADDEKLSAAVSAGLEVVGS